MKGSTEGTHIRLLLCSVCVLWYCTAWWCSVINVTQSLSTQTDVCISTPSSVTHSTITQSSRITGSCLLLPRPAPTLLTVCTTHSSTLLAICTTHSSSPVTGSCLLLPRPALTLLTVCTTHSNSPIIGSCLLLPRPALKPRLHDTTCC